MKNSLFQRAAQFYKEQRRKKLWHRIVSGMACVVVFCTVYALILPAITLEKDPVCGMVEHTHTEECYAVETVWPSTEYRCDEVSLSGHTHNGSCYDEHDELVCGYADVVVHTHNSLCYDQNGRLSCPLEEIEEHQHSAACFRTQNVLTCEEAETGHIHNDQCFTRTRGELICGQEEQTGHTHGSACYDTTQILVCGLTEDGEHSHGESCYETQKTLACKQAESAGHTHTDDCYAWTKTPTCGKEENLEGHIHSSDCYTVKTEQICGKEELLLHTHCDACFGRDGNLICGKLQVLSHEHSVDCVTKPEGGSEEVRTLICGLEEHTHTDQCYVKNGENAYNCGLAEHTHGVDCYDETGNLICTLLEHVHNETCLTPAEPEKPDYVCGKEAHTHGEDCYDENGGLICTLPEHVHDETCLTPPEPETPDYVCGKEAHTHGEDCYDENGGLICTLPEHVHDETCLSQETPNYVCGRTEHTHGADCYDETGSLICTLREHVHSQQCLAPAEGVQQELTYEGADYTVSVSFGKEAALPEGVTLSVREILQGTEEYESYSRQTQAALAAKQTEGAERVLFARFFDVQLLLNGQEVEPSAPVTVTVTYDKKVDVTGRDVSCQTVHFAEDGPEILKTESADDPDSGATSFTHTQDSFSVMVCLVTQTMANKTDIGPDNLPVDYYVCIDGEWTRVGATRTGWYGTKKDNDEWLNENRDYITVAQAASILGDYGFSETGNPARKIAYQQKTGNRSLYSDTDSVTLSNYYVIPLSRNTNGYNLYYLPANADKISNKSLEGLDTAANSFYTVTVVDDKGKTLEHKFVLSGGEFTYTVPEDSTVKSWLVAYANGSHKTVSAETGEIKLENITSAVQISPAQDSADTVVGHSVTFKVLIDGAWQEVGSLPYYYADSDNSRAYITSDMAAQVLGDFGYDEDTKETEIGYSYNDIYTIYYSNTDYCMDVRANKIQNSQPIQLYESNKSDAQVFRIWWVNEESDYCFITPIANSSYHVNVLGGGTDNGKELALHEAKDKASQWKVVHNGNGTVCFYNANAPASAAIDLPYGNVGSTSNPPQLHIWADGSYRYWTLEQQYRISNDTQITDLADGTYKISLTAESNGDIVCYYMPGVTSRFQTYKTEETLPTNGNQFWSVKVVDESQGVYTVAQQESMTQYVKDGGSADVTVQNAEGVLWACRKMYNLDVTVTVDRNTPGQTTFHIKGINQPIEVTATRANPNFTVQYYAEIPRFATAGDKTLKVIDTTGGILPTNGGNIVTKDLSLEKINRNTTQNNGEKTPLYRVATTLELTKMYSQETFQYATAPDLNYFNKLKENSNYDLKEIWVLKTGKGAESLEREDWDIYEYQAGMTFTNLASQVNENTILINDGAVLRLVSGCSTSEYHNGTTFYDYNISSGKSGSTWQTYQTGINASSNYGKSLNGRREWNSQSDVFAFGNANCGTGMEGVLFAGGTLNKFNSVNNGANGATFGLVQGLNNDGTIKYNQWLVVPKLFNEKGSANGKQTYAGSTLMFERQGDTYTLSSATLKNSNGTSSTIKDLQYFFNPSPTSGVIWDGEHGPKKSDGTTWNSKIFTNNFWPMDKAAGKTDDLWGAYGNPGKFQNGTFPEGDDGRAHNWFFGMNFALSFSLTEDYVGPLEYYFFGDDDLWVFLDGKLVCDIGGVHSSIGEYVNLRDYLPEGSTGRHTLSFFYTERGASGSTCYMSFTLPSVSSATTGRDMGQLKIGKTLSASQDALSDVEYEFKVTLTASEDGPELDGRYSYTRMDSSGKSTYGTVASGETIKLRHGETALIDGLPAGTYYKVEELTTGGYEIFANNKKGTIAKGKITDGTATTADFVNTPLAYTLPVTGNTGPLKYTLEGLCLTAGALFLLYKIKTRGKGGKADPC